MLAQLTAKMRKITGQVQAIESRQNPSRKYRRYKNDPIGFAEDVLHIHTLTPDQKEILRHLLIPPCSVLVPSGHDTGKTFLAGIAVNWWYETRYPCGIMTLGPRYDSLKETVWAEVRMQRARAGLRDDFIGPSAPEMRSAPDHWAKALTASKDASLTGRHIPNMFFLFEEACAVAPIWWQVTSTMFDPTLGHARLGIFNPTDPTSEAFQQDLRCREKDERDDTDDPPWHRFRLSALEHPNIAAELAGLPKPVPSAVSLKMVEGWLKEWCEPTSGNLSERKATDIHFPPGSGKWFRPGPVFQARVLGLWPESGAGVWSDALVSACMAGPAPDYPLTLLPRIGCDCAQGKGDDFHAIHCRWGPTSIHHETANTMDPVQIAGRLRENAGMLIDMVNERRPKEAKPIEPQRIVIVIDDDGTGGAIRAILSREGYIVVPIGAGTGAVHPEKYPNKRSELWFDAAERAAMGQLNLSQLDRDSKRRIRQQLMAPEWDQDAAGRRVVEPKDVTKGKIGRSPDDADAVNLCYFEGATATIQAIEPQPAPRVSPYQKRK